MSQSESKGGTTLPSFDPNDHLMDLKGKAYLEVKWRLLWIDKVCQQFKIRILKSDVRPDLPVEKEVEVWNNSTKRKEPKTLHGKGWAYYEVEVEDDRGRVGQANGSESVLDFGDYIEKAFTKAVGRALALIGYGTQHAPEFDEGERIVDAPVVTAITPTVEPPPDPPSPTPPPSTPKPKAQEKTEKKEMVAPVPTPPKPKVVSTPKPVIVPSPSSELIEAHQTAVDALMNNAGPYEQEAILIYWNGKGQQMTEPLTQPLAAAILKDDAFFDLEQHSNEWQTVDACQQIVAALDLWKEDKEDGRLHWVSQKILPHQQLEIVQKWGKAFGNDAVKTLKAEQFNAADTNVSGLTRGVADKMVAYLRTGELSPKGKIVPKTETIAITGNAAA